jgi:hypothetical protein
MKQLLLTLFLCLTLWTGMASAEPSDVFHNPTTGFTVTKPPAWHYATAAQHVANLRAMKLNDQAFHTAMLRYATAPLLALQKFPEPFADVNPSFKVNLKPLGQLKGKRPTELLTLLLPQLQRAFSEVQVVQLPMEVEVAQIPSAYARLNYSLRTHTGETFPITSEVWIVPRGEYFFLLGAGTRQDEQTGTRAEIHAIVDSIRIEQ